MSSRRRRLYRLADTRVEGTDHASEYPDEIISGDSIKDVDVAAVSALNFHAVAESTKVQLALVGRVREYVVMFYYRLKTQQMLINNMSILLYILGNMFRL